MAASIASACVVAKFLSPRLPRRTGRGKGVSETSGTGARVVTGTAATYSAEDARLREQGGGEHGPV